jgi:hypothetical protein
LLLAKRGTPPDVLLRRVDFLPSAERLYRGYWEIDRSEWGVPLMSGMRAVLDEYGWTDPFERGEIRDLWRSMHREESKARDEKRKAAEEAKGRGEEGTSSKGGVLKRFWDRTLGKRGTDEDDED